MQLIDSIVSVLAPHVCIGCAKDGSVLCADCIHLYFEPSEPRCIGCMKLSEGFKVCTSCRRKIPLERVIFCSAYEGVSEELVKSLKYEFKRQSADAIAFVMAETLKTCDCKFETVVPIPTSPSRVRTRGFDHSELIGRALAKNIRAVYKKLLWRSSDAHQVGANRAERFRQMKNVFQLHNRDKKETATSVLLIDDVYTTGATIASATNILKKSGVKHISAIVFARKI